MIALDTQYLINVVVFVVQVCLDGKISEGYISINTNIDTIKKKKTDKEIVFELMANFQ